MYSFTIIGAEVKIFQAAIDFECVHCERGDGEKGIKQGDKFYWITGERTYKRIKVANGIGKKEFVPYIPFELKKKLKDPKMDPLFFEDRIVGNKICEKCFSKFKKFISPISVIPTDHESVWKIQDSFTMRIYTAMRGYEYTCGCCGHKIVGNEDYVRQGHYKKICLKCAQGLKRLIGTEFSYGE